MRDRCERFRNVRGCFRLTLCVVGERIAPPDRSRSVTTAHSPIQHTVVFRLVHPAGSPEETEFLDTAARVLTGIPGVEDFTVDRQVSAQSDLVWRFSMRFADQAAYDAYNTHPDHVGFVAGRWVPEVAGFQEYDFVAR